jgi:hypothetical protein
MLPTNRSAVGLALAGLALIAAVLLASVQPAAAQGYILFPVFLPYAPPDLVVKVTAPAHLDYWYGDGVTITVENTLTTVNGKYAGSAANGVSVEVHFTGLTVVSVQADSGLVCLPIYPAGARGQFSLLDCSYGAIPAGSKATINVIVGLIGTDPAAQYCWPAYTDARTWIYTSGVVERDMTNNRAIAATEPC